MSRDSDHKQDNRPSHIAYQVREGEDQKSYFNRVGSSWPHKDGEGHTIQLDSVPVDGRIVLRSAKERINDMREEKSDERKGSKREARRDNRDAGPRYER